MIDNRVQEDIHLDYKESRALVGSRALAELPKDVSAFANSDGGLLVYGIREKDHFPQEIDGGLSNNEMTRERLEHLVMARISPRIEGISIAMIPLDAGAAFAVRIPKSTRAPHQEGHKKRYYKRYNFESVPMEHYEIEDLRARSLVVPDLLHLTIESASQLPVLVLRNEGESPAHRITFEVDGAAPWLSTTPQQVASGIATLNPRQVLRFPLRPFTEPATITASFRIGLSYTNVRLQRRCHVDRQFDLSAYAGTSPNLSERDKAMRDLIKQVRSLDSTMKSIAQTLRDLGGIADPTGLTLSVHSIRRLGALNPANSSQDHQMDPRDLSPERLREMLGIPLAEAFELFRILRENGSFEDLRSSLGTRERELFDRWVRRP